MPYKAPSRLELLDLLKRLQGTGYASEEGTARAVELEAIAEVAAKASEALTVASDNASPSGISEIASAYEYAHQLPTDDSLTIQERRDRAVAFTRALPQATEARFIGAANTLNTGLYETASYLSLNNKPARGPRAYWRGLSVGDASQPLDAVRLILDRASAASVLPAGSGRFGLSYSLSWNSPSDNAVLHADSGMSGYLESGKPDTSAIEVTLGQTVTTGLLDEIRRSLYWHPTAGVGGTAFYVANSDDLPPAQTCGEWIVCLGSIANATTATLDASNWANQLASAYGIVSATNITTGGGVDTASLAATDRVYCETAKHGFYRQLTASDGTGSGVLIAFSNTGVTLQNNSGGTRYFLLFVRGTARWSTTATTHAAADAIARKTTFPQLEVTWMTRNTSVRDGNITTNWTRTLVTGSDTAYRGAHRRIIYSGPTAIAANATSGVPVTVVVDTSIDWRGRWVMVYGTVQGSANSIVAANWDQLQPLVSPGPFTVMPTAFFTGTGGTATTFCASLGSGLPQPYRMYARSTDGALIVEHASSGVGGHVYACGLWFVVAAPKSSDATCRAPLDGAYAAPVDLAEPQMSGTWQQGWPSAPNPQHSAFPTTQSVPTNPPLGLISEGGSPPVPVQWTQRERVGIITDPSIVVRQRIFGQRKRMISLSVPAAGSRRLEAANGESGEPVDEIDYRDRLVWVSGNVGSTDATIGTASGTADTSNTPFVCALYTGPYGTQSVTIATGVTLVFTFAKSTSGRGVHSELSFANSNGSTRYINAVLECTGQLGLSDNRTTGL